MDTRWNSIIIHMNRFELSHQDSHPESIYYTNREFFIPERERPVAIMKYTIFLPGRLIITSFWTVNGIGRRSVLREEVVDKLWSSEFWRRLYPWIWTACLQYFTRTIPESTLPIKTIEIESDWRAIGFYRKAANSLLESWNIYSWKQGDEIHTEKLSPLLLTRFYTFIVNNVLLLEAGNRMQFTLYLENNQ